MKNDVLKLLDEKNIKYEIVEHEVVHTMEDMESLCLRIQGKKYQAKIREGFNLMKKEKCEELHI